MDPISIAIEIELGTILIAGIAAIYAKFHHKHQKRVHEQREAHHQQVMAMHERHYAETKEWEEEKSESPTIIEVVET